MSRFAGQSKFFGGGDSSESEESHDSDEEEQKKDQTITTDQVTKARAKFVGSDDEEEERTIKSGKTKRLEALEKILDDTRKHMNISDYNALDADFTKLEAEIKKNADEIFEDKRGEVLPNKVLKILMQLEDQINEITGADKKKMTKLNSVSYNKLKQKFKKYLAAEGDGDMSFENQVAKYRANPPESESEEESDEDEDDDEEEEEEEESEEEGEEEEEEESDSDSDAEEAKKAQAAVKEEAKKEKKEEEGDEEEYGDEYYDEEDGDEAQSGESGDEVVLAEGEIDPKLAQKYSFLFKEREEMTPDERRWKWVRKDAMPVELIDIIDKLSRKKVKKTADERKADKQVKATDAVDEGEEGEDYTTQINARTDLLLDYTVILNVRERLVILRQERIKGKFNANFHVQVLTKMATEMKVTDLSESRLKIEVIILLIGTLFQTAKLAGCLNRDQWLTTSTQVSQLMDLITTEEFKKALKEAHSPESYKQGDPTKEESDGEIDDRELWEVERSVFPSLSNFIERLDEQLWKSYQSLSHNNIAYLQRIQDENNLLFAVDRIASFFTEFKQNEYSARVAVIKLTYLYYKNDSIYARIKNRLAAQGKNASENGQIYFLEDSEAVIQKLVSSVHKFGTPRQRVRATLCQVYHHALHNRLSQAKDLIMKTHINQVISLQHVDNQILYNRALTQTGMAAFRLGKVTESHEILNDICQNSKYKELLAQKFSSLQEKSSEYEAEEKRRQIPFHMTINLQVLDCIHLITSMLIEIPSFAQHQFTMHKNVASKNFKRLIDYYDQRAFNLAAEQYRDNIVLAARALNKSDWELAIQNIFNISFIARLPEFESGILQQNLVQSFKESALRAFLFRGAKQYSSFSLDSLTTMFELPKQQVLKFVSKMILKNELQVRIDQAKELIVLDEKGEDIKELQQLSLQYVNQIQTMVQQNERLVEFMGLSKKADQIGVFDRTEGGSKGPKKKQ